MCDSLIVDLIRLGFTGASVVFLFFGYRLTATITAQSPANLTPNQLRMAELRSRTVRWFLGFSMALFILGVISEIGSKKLLHLDQYPVLIKMHPKSLSDMLSKEEMPLVQQRSNVPLNFENGAATIHVMYEDFVDIEFERVADLLRKYKQASARQMSQSTDAGFDYAHD